MKTAIILLALAGLTSCAIALTEEEAAKCEGDEACLAEALEDKKVTRRFEREDRDIRYRDEFFRFAAWCESTGDVVTIERKVSSTRCRGNCPPRFGDNYSCGPPPRLQQRY